MGQQRSEKLKAYRKKWMAAWRKTAAGITYLKEYAQRPEVKARQKAFQTTESYKANRTKYRKTAKPQAYAKAYNRSEKERLRQRTKRLVNRSYHYAHTLAYLARKKSATIGNMAAIQAVYARAQVLRQWFDVAVDHIFPLSKGGAHSADNLQIIYSKENSAKGNRLDYVPSLVFA